MLPSYLAYLFMRNSGDARPPTAVKPAGMLRGIAAGGLMTLGFLVVFVAAGLIVSVAVQLLRTVLPWLTIGIAAGLILLGTAVLAGRTPSWFAINVPMPVQTHKSRQGYQAFFVYGLLFAVASLGCTMPVFMVVVAQAFSGGLAQGIAGFTLYALGMGLVVTALSVAVALARATAEQWLRKMLPLMEKAGAFLVIGAGAYLIYYWLWGAGSLVR